MRQCYDHFRRCNMGWKNQRKTVIWPVDCNSSGKFRIRKKAADFHGPFCSSSVKCKAWNSKIRCDYTAVRIYVGNTYIKFHIVVSSDNMKMKRFVIGDGNVYSTAVAHVSRQTEIVRRKNRCFSFRTYYRNCKRYRLRNETSLLTR